MVRVSPIKITVKNKAPSVTQHTTSQYYTTLEATQRDNFLKDTGAFPTSGMYFISNLKDLPNEGRQNVSQVSVFQDSMKILYVAGQFLGLVSVTGLLGKDVTKLRFSFLSWRYLYSLLIIFPQMIFTTICFYSLICNRVSISTIVFACFYASTSMTCVNFISISTKWPTLITKLLNSKTDEYTDRKVVKKCVVISVVYFCVLVVNHTLRVIDRISTVNDYYPDSSDVLKIYCHMIYGWLFELNFPYNNFVAVFLIILNVTAAFIWSYSDLFITCISLYLSSIIKQMNKKIEASSNTNLSMAYWKSLREDYNCVTDIVRSFDEVINGVVFSSFANNLFFVCFHIYYLLSPINGYGYSVYYITSLLFILLRFLSVALFAAEIHTVSLTAAPYLYNVPSTVFCSEVERFINQIQGNIVALSGLKFFYVTREFVLSVVGTIITYELVLLQLNSN